MNRLINRQVRKPLAEAILRGELENGDTARVRLNERGDGLEVVAVKAPKEEGSGEQHGGEGERRELEEAS